MNLVQFLKSGPDHCEIIPNSNFGGAQKRELLGTLYRGFVLRADQKVRLARPLGRQPHCDISDDLGWILWADDLPADAFLRVTLNFAGLEVANEERRIFPGVYNTIPFPRTLATNCLPSELDFHCSFHGCEGRELFLAVHRVLNRQPLYDLCTGSGLEIGPGPKPQILADENRDVIYVEQMGYEEWFRLYKIPGASNDPKIWSKYRVGDAHRLPVPPQSCDFIFSSHVFEHLANPIGHLAVWLSHLRSGGKIVAVVPDMSATSDYMMEPSTIEDIVAEYKAGLFDPELRHYERAKRKYGKTFDARNALNERKSIHIHFYLARTLATLLEHASKMLPIAGWGIQATRNHKDFHFVVYKK